MKKRWKRWLPAAIVVVLALVLLWPLSLPALENYDDLPVSHSYHWLNDSGDCAVLESTAESYDLDDPAILEQLNDALQNYSYHRCLHTLFPFLSQSNASQGSHVLTFALSQGDGVEALILTDGRHMHYGDRTYCLGYWGNHAAEAATQEILEILSRVPEKAPQP